MRRSLNREYGPNSKKVAAVQFCRYLFVAAVSFILGSTFNRAALLESNAAPDVPKQAAADVQDRGSSNSISGSSNSKSSQERDFRALGTKYHTDKVCAHDTLGNCLENGKGCIYPKADREECRPWGHFYDTLYQRRLGSYATDGTEPFQFLEIGFYEGGGYETYKEFFGPAAEAHSLELFCEPNSPATKNKRFEEYRANDRLHCGDASNLNFLNHTWTTHMKRPGAPPLKVIIEDGSHQAAHMVQSVFFWLSRLEPRGMLVVEDIQPIPAANKFRTQFLPQIMSDLHYCGETKGMTDAPCFPTLMPLLASIHCEMHICVFERNDKPAVELSLEESKAPVGALDLKTCKSLSP